MTWNQFWSQVLDALIPLLALAVTVAISLLAEWLRRKAAQVRQDTARESLLAAIAEMEVVATDAIMATQQVLVDSLKEAAEDGKLTREEAELAMRMAIAYFETHVTPGTLRVIQAAYGPIEAWLRDYLEARIAAAKGPPYTEIEAIVDPLS